MRTLKQSTARTVMVFMTDSADHITGKASLTLTITASKNGAAFGSISPSVTDRGSGWYAIDLTTSHTDTLGELALHITGSGADPTDALWTVVAFDQADAVRLGLSALPNAAAAASGGLPTVGTGSGQINLSGGRADANVTHFGGTVAPAPAVAGVPKTESTIGTGALSFATLAADLVAALGIMRRGTAQTGSTSTTLKLDAGASASDDAYNGMTGFIASGTGAGQGFYVSDYVGSTKVASIESTGTNGVWPIATPDNTSVFVIMMGSGRQTDAARATWARVLEGSHTSGDLVRLLVGVICGTVADFETDTQAYKSLDGSKTRLTVTTSVTGRDAITVGNLT